MNLEKIELADGQEVLVSAPQCAVALRKPRIALMGEFSAGKSTLANLLAGGQHLPVQVTATQLPPVWMSFGTAQAYRVDLEGRTIPVSLARLEDVPIAETAFVRIFEQSAILAKCDIIDMPGISDPNMSAKVWQRVLPEADGVIWCTHATQAWRQSESAIWATMTPELQRRSLLLLTRIDKIVVDRDRQRIIKRVDKETEGQFSGPSLAISLTQALAAKSDSALLGASGALALFDQLDRLVQAISVDLGHPSAATDLVAPAQVAAVQPRRIRSEIAQAATTPRPAHGTLPPEIAAFRAALGRG
jgi:GTPase SAR1 family protein